ncbi:HlyD family secretion protein, partial [Pseudomonas edaphica]
MTLEKPLFRLKALEAHKQQWLGEIMMIRPTSFTFLTLMAAAMAALVIGFLFWGSYTKRSTVTGQLVPASGQVKVYVHQPGIVLEKFVNEGQVVQRGQPLLSLSSERYGSDAGPVQAGISQQLRQRGDSLRDQLEKQRHLQVDERVSLTSKVASLQQEVATLVEQADSQRRLVTLATDAAERYQGLMDKGYI